MLTSAQPVVVIGTGPAAFAAAQSLRTFGFEGALTIVGEEPDHPYDRPPLSKQVLEGAWPPEKASLLPQPRLDNLRAELLLGVAATSLEIDEHLVRLDDGRSLEYSALVLATGVRPRRLAHEDLQNVLVLRTMQQALRLREALLEPGRKLVIVGGGFLGLEIAATATRIGAKVTVVEPLPGPPLAERIGHAAALKLLETHQRHGVSVLTGLGVSGFSGTPPGPSSSPPGSRGAPPRPAPVRNVHLTNGTTLPADVVLIAIGSNPAVEWLADSGLHIDDGIVCDAYCAAGPDVWAAGDVARWLHRGVNRHVRLEHRTNAAEQGRAVAQNILGQRQPFEPVPFFWTDQFGTKIQLAGVLPPDAELGVVEGSLDGDQFLQTICSNGRLMGVVGWNSARSVTARRREIAASLTSTAA